MSVALEAKRQKLGDLISSMRMSLKFLGSRDTDASDSPLLPPHLHPPKLPV